MSQQKIKNLLILRASDEYGLCHSINTYLTSGFELHGGIFPFTKSDGTTHYCQAVIKYHEEEAVYLKREKDLKEFADAARKEFANIPFFGKALDLDNPVELLAYIKLMSDSTKYK